MRFSSFLSELLDFAERDESGNIVISGSTILSGSQTLDIEEMAIFSVIDLIASAGSLCEWKTYQNDVAKKGADWYAWNVAPNQNQNATEFKRLLLARLLRYNEALVFARNGQYYIADNFTRETYAFYPNTYSGISLNDLQLSYTLTEPDVFYFRISDANAAGRLRHLNSLYSKAIEEAWDKYQHSGGKSGILKISSVARGRPTFESDIETLMNDRFKRFFQSKNAVLPLFEGYDYVPQDSASNTKSANEVTDISNLIRQAQDSACNAYHVPPSILRGDVSGVSDAIDAMLSFAVKPTMEIIQTEVNRKSYGKSVLDGWRVKIDTTHIKTTDVFAVAEKADKLIQDSIYSVNGIREKVGDDPIREDWADDYIRTKNVETVNREGTEE